MKFTTLFTALAATTLPSTLAYPGMEEALKEVELLARADSFSPNQLLGDLRTLKDNQLTRDGREIKAILSGRGNPENFDGYSDVPRRDSAKCRQDPCCVWKYISDDLERLFQGRSGRCTKWARFAIRMGFHDAGTWSLATDKQGGGADGSILLAAGELGRGENSGLGDMGDVYRGIYTKYRNQLGFKDVTMADLIQMGANIATVVCPLGPRVRSWVGRRDSTTPAPRGLLPSPFADANSLIQLFKDKTISPRGLIALLGAHTTSQQNVVDASRAGDPQDSTPGVWDVLYYQQTLGQAATPDRVFMFQSDLNLAKHPVTKRDFESFAGQGGQGRWNQDYAREYIRLSLLGVNNINKLKECTKVLPKPTRGFRHKDQGRLSKWLESDDSSQKSKKVSKEVEDGDEISTPEDQIPGWKNRKNHKHHGHKGHKNH